MTEFAKNAAKLRRYISNAKHRKYILIQVVLIISMLTNVYCLIHLDYLCSTHFIMKTIRDTEPNLPTQA